MGCGCICDWATHIALMHVSRICVPACICDWATHIVLMHVSENTSTTYVCGIINSLLDSLISSFNRKDIKSNNEKSMNYKSVALDIFLFLRKQLHILN